MSLDIRLVEFLPTVVYDDNITHNLTFMAKECGLYEVIWRPLENGYRRAGAMIIPLEEGLKQLRSEVRRLKKLEPSNGWGDHATLVNFTARLLKYCKKYPEAGIEIYK